MPTPPGPDSVTRPGPANAATRVDQLGSRPSTSVRRTSRRAAGGARPGRGRARSRPDRARSRRSLPGGPRHRRPCGRRRRGPRRVERGSCTSTAWCSSAAAGDGSMPSSSTQVPAVASRSWPGRRAGGPPGTAPARGRAAAPRARGARRRASVSSSATRAWSPRARRARASASCAVEPALVELGHGAAGELEVGHLAVGGSPPQGERPFEQLDRLCRVRRLGRPASSTSAVNSSGVDRRRRHRQRVPGRRRHDQGPGAGLGRVERPAQLRDLRGQETRRVRAVGALAPQVVDQAVGRRPVRPTWTTRSASRARTFAPWMGTVAAVVGPGGDRPEHAEAHPSDRSGRRGGSDAGYGRGSGDRQPTVNGLGHRGRRQRRDDQPTKGTHHGQDRELHLHDDRRRHHQHAGLALRGLGRRGRQGRRRDHGRPRGADHGPQDLRRVLPGLVGAVGRGERRRPHELAPQVRRVEHADRPRVEQHVGHRRRRRGRADPHAEGRAWTATCCSTASAT